MELSDVLPVIYTAIRNANGLRPPDDQLPCAPDTVLYGPGSSLDSLTQVSLILDIEMEIDSRFGVQMVLANERAMMETRNPFRDVASLAAYIGRRLAETESCVMAR